MRSKPGFGKSPGVHLRGMEESGDQRIWDEIRASLVTSEIQVESRQDAHAVATTEVALMRLDDRGRRSRVIEVHVAGKIVTGRISMWTHDIAILESGQDSWAIRVGAIDAIVGLGRALRTHVEDPATVRSILDCWSLDEVEVWTPSGRFHGPLVVAADHLEVAGVVIPWHAVRTVRRRT